MNYIMNDYLFNVCLNTNQSNHTNKTNIKQITYNNKKYYYKIATNLSKIIIT